MCRNLSISNQPIFPQILPVFLISCGTPTLAHYAVGLHSPVDKKTIVCCKRRAEYVVSGSNTVVAQSCAIVFGRVCNPRNRQQQTSGGRPEETRGM